MKIVKSHDDKMVEDEQELTPQVRYWAISPGEKAKLWDDFKSNNLIAIGWDKLGDLRQYSSKDDIRSKIVQLYGDETSITNDALACYQFAQVIQLGDYIFVKKG